MTRRDGFTLVELVVALAIVVVLGAVGVPYLLASLPTVRVNGAARQVAADFRLARTLSVARGLDVFIRFDVPSADCYTLVCDTDPAPPNNDKLLTDKDERIKTVKLAALHKGIGIARYGKGAAGRNPSGDPLPEDGVSFQGATAVFNPDGRARAGSVYLRPALGSATTQERCVTVTGATGRARIYARKGATTWE